MWNHHKQKFMNNKIHTHTKCINYIYLFLQKCPELMPFCNGILGEERYQGRKEINSVLHTLNQRSRNNPEVKKKQKTKICKLYSWQLHYIEENKSMLLMKWTVCIHVIILSYAMKVQVNCVAVITLGRHLSLSSSGECSCLEGCCKCCAGPAGVPCWHSGVW